MNEGTENKPASNWINKILKRDLLLLTPILFVYLIFMYVLLRPKYVPTELINTPAPAATNNEPVNQTDNLKKMAEANPTEANYINLSMAYFSAKQYRECIEASRKVIERNPNNVIAYNNICAAYNCLSLWDSAIIAADAALKIQPDYQLVKNNRNWALQMKNKAR